MTKFIQTHKVSALLSSLLILAPIPVGLWLWDALPNPMLAHWGADGVGDGVLPKALAVFGLPVFLLVLHWAALLCTAADPKNRNQNRRAMGLLFWIMPMASLFTAALSYSIALGRKPGPEGLFPLFVGVLFIVLGNYLPKLRQNSTFGIRLPWTVYQEEVWDRTHRMSGKLWVAGGFLLLVTYLLPDRIFLPVLLADLLVLTLVPALYACRLYHKLGGPKLTVRPKTATAWVSLLLGAALAVGCGVLLFTGDIQLRLEENSFTVEADYYPDLTVAYGDIDALELRATDQPGRRTNGVGTPRLSMGSFRNEEFGPYTRYTYTGVPTCIVLRSGTRVLVLGGRDEGTTRSLYDQLNARIPH